MLGPSLACAKYEGEWMPLNELFALHLCKELDKDKVGYDPEHQRNLTYIAQKFLSIPSVRRIDLVCEIEEAYQNHVHEIPPIYHQLAQLPFHLIVNTTPDDFMLKALEQAGKYNGQQAWYNFQKDSEPDISNISADAPLVYHLFGSLQDPESLVLTEQDQVDFVRNIVKDEPPVPPKIMSQFDAYKTYLFLEFDLRNWHFRLVLDGLNLTNQNNTFAPQFSKATFNNLTKGFYQQRFNFQFIDKNLPDFATELSDKYHAAQPVNTTNKKWVYKAKKLFIAAAMEDEQNYLQPLVKYLYPMEMNGFIKVWHRQKMLASFHKNATITTELEQADVAIFLLSADFLASEELLQEKGIVQQALEQQKMGKTKVIPILARHCLWEQAEFAALPMLPHNKKPIDSKEDWESPDFAFREIVKGLEKMIFG